ncbi:GyrI-like domain-containing protein [Gilvimarinus sp. SDUM040013]|uniref:GyrI-like domain-containing protein n=1 Tax=Gilvimarinus gilvus TaxID=3058038 RepID=A0ABU4S415_9GAMM|nr:GyrI-like domain-containing protein [Gilvimarinus sp. SDUM040013]MDO3384952.1 GyrI-like domain-containing protein [Gilvimarinus sp. SDUM040013]MDX6851252.1 GyrI-like domain-containing protein [Gilvimarinus sp. SDUM040013]
MEKIDYKKKLKHLYRPSAKVVQQVEVPPLRYLMVDGTGEPGSASYQEAIEALYKVSYTAKFTVKKGSMATDYAVMPLEGLWWADDMRVFETGDKSQWLWTMMIMQPDIVPDTIIEQCIESVREKNNVSGLDRLRLQTFDEGLCMQTMHIGPFSEEGPTVARVHEAITEVGNLRGKHHEIYLSDIRRANPSNWKTVIRQPYE